MTTVEVAEQLASFTLYYNVFAILEGCKTQHRVRVGNDRFDEQKGRVLRYIGRNAAHEPVARVQYAVGRSYRVYRAGDSHRVICHIKLDMIAHEPGGVQWITSEEVKAEGFANRDEFIRAWKNEIDSSVYSRGNSSDATTPVFALYFHLDTDYPTHEPKWADPYPPSENSYRGGRRGFERCCPVCAAKGNYLLPHTERDSSGEPTGRKVCKGKDCSYVFSRGEAKWVRGADKGTALAETVEDVPMVQIQ